MGKSNRLHRKKKKKNTPPQPKINAESFLSPRFYELENPFSGLNEEGSTPFLRTV